MMCIGRGRGHLRDERMSTKDMMDWSNFRMCNCKNARSIRLSRAPHLVFRNCENFLMNTISEGSSWPGDDTSYFGSSGKLSL